MAIVMQMRWDGVTAEEYEQAQAEVKWEVDPPAGGIFHVAWLEDGVLRVCDAWHSAEQFQTFVDERLMPGVAKVGIQASPR